MGDDLLAEAQAYDAGLADGKYVMKARYERAERERDRLIETLRSLDRLLDKEELSEGVEVTIPRCNHQLIGQIIFSSLGVKS